MLAVGPGRRTKDGELLPVGVKAGDKVLLPEYGGSLVKMDQKEWVVRFHAEKRILLMSHPLLQAVSISG